MADVDQGQGTEACMTSPEDHDEAKVDRVLLEEPTEDRQNHSRPNNDDNIENDSTLTEPLQPGESASTSLSGGATKWLIMTTTIICLGSSGLFGYCVGVVNLPTQHIKSFFNETYYNRGTPKDPITLDFIWTITVSIFVLFAPVGAFVTGVVVDKYGRKRIILANHVIIFVASILQSITKLLWTPELLIVGRALAGLNAGISSMVAIVYINEIAPQRIRGSLGTCHQFAIVLGLLISQILGFKEILGTQEHWPLLFALPVVPAFISCVVLPFCPDSPKWLITIKKDEEKGRLALVKLRGTNNVEFELDLIKTQTMNSSHGRNITVKELFTLRELRVPFITAIVLQMAQQWSGINFVNFYSEMIFRETGMGDDIIQYAVLSTGIVLLIVTAISIPLCERLGRRILLIVPILCMIISYCVLVTSINLKDTTDWVKYLSIVSIMTFVLSFGIGIGPLAFVIIGELFHTEARSTATSVILMINWTLVFIQTVTFRPLQHAIGEFTFLLFVMNLVVCLMYLYFILPETKNRPVATVLQELNRRVDRIKRFLPGERYRVED